MRKQRRFNCVQIIEKITDIFLYEDPPKAPERVKSETSHKTTNS
jgi:hypothetical protein